MHFRRAFPVLRPVVVITPNPDGASNMKSGSVSALTLRPSRAERMSRLCFGACAAAASRTRAASLASVAPITGQQCSHSGGGGGQGRSLTRRLHRYGTTVMRLVGVGPIGAPVSVGSR
jgi:hypothetical protein